MIKIAAVYERADNWYFEPSSRTRTGLWIATLPLIQLNKQDPRQRKGEAAVETLNASQELVPLPDPKDDLSAPLLAMAKVKSWSTFIRSAKCVALELENGRLSILPHQSLGSKGALESIPEQTIVLPDDATAEEIGAAIENAFTRCPR